MENSVLLVNPKDVSEIKAISESMGINVSELNGKVSFFDIEYESILNFVPLVFNADEKWLSDCEKVFIYWHKNKDSFKFQQCVDATGVTLHFVNKIYDKYLKY